MPKQPIIICFYGASGAGKSTLLKMLQKNIPDISIHKKDTTRPPRKKENKSSTFELTFKNKLDKNDYVYIYSQYGYEYGIRKDQIRDAIQKKNIHLIIVNDIRALKKFKQIFPQTKLVYVHSDPTKIPARIRQKDTLPERRRRRRIEEQYKNFIENNTLFDYCIINFWNKKIAFAQAQNIIKEIKRLDNH